MYNKINNHKISLFLSLIILITFTSCEKDDIQKEDVPELITKATLTFSPISGGTAVVVTATDPDGDGVQDIMVDGDINLVSGESYLLEISLINELADPLDPEYDISEEVEEEGAEHMFFFSWTNNVFSDPAGDGNIDNRSDPVNYTGGSNSVDANGRPLGLTTTWTASSSMASGTFRVILKHQPELKSDTSGSTVGETDLDITFNISIL